MQRMAPTNPRAVHELEYGYSSPNWLVGGGARDGRYHEAFVMRSPSNIHPCMRGRPCSRTQVLDPHPPSGLGSLILKVGIPW